MSNEALKEFGRKLFKNTLPKVAKGVIVATPIGRVLDEIGILDSLGEKFGIDEIEDLETTVDNPEILAKLEELKAEVLRIQLENETAIYVEDTKRIQSVNETIRAEVIGNPEAGAWRPLWGRVACWTWVFQVVAILSLLGYDVAVGEYQLIGQLALLTGLMFAINTMPAAILGVASWHRGGEKKILATKKS